MVRFTCTDKVKPNINDLSRVPVNEFLSGYIQLIFRTHRYHLSFIINHLLLFFRRFIA